jgi:hypothetical protein
MPPMIIFDKIIFTGSAHIGKSPDNNNIPAYESANKNNTMYINIDTKPIIMSEP